MKKEDWPRNNGKRIADGGKLPLDVPEIDLFLADPTHRVKVIVKPLFNIATGPKKKPKRNNESRLRTNKNKHWQLHQTVSG